MLSDLGGRVQAVLSPDGKKGGLLRQIFATGGNGNLKQGNWLDLLSRSVSEGGKPVDFFTSLKDPYLYEIENHAQIFHNLTGEMAEGLSQEMEQRVREDFQDERFEDEQWDKLRERYDEAKDHAKQVRGVVGQLSNYHGNKRSNAPTTDRDHTNCQWQRWVHEERAVAEQHEAKNNR